MPPIHPEPIDSLTSLRGLLAVWVVLYHFWKDAIALFPSLEALTPLISQGYLAVPVFFILSGFVLAYNYANQLWPLDIRTYCRFMVRRGARIYGVHLAGLLTVLAMVVVCRARGWPLADGGYGSREFVLNLLLVQTWVPDFHLNWNYPSWSISSEWFAYLWFPIAWATVLRRMATGRRALVFLGLCWAATVALYVLGNELPFRELIRVLPTFLAGTAVYLCLVRRPACTPRLCCLPDLLLLGLAAVPFATTGRFTVALLLTGFLALVYLLAYQRQNCTALWTHCFGVYLGEVSYSLYMTHTLAQKVCYKLLPAERFIGTSAAARLAVVLGYLASVMIGSLAMYYVIERPSRRWLARPSLGGGRRPGRAARGLFANSTPPTNRGDSSARQGVGTARNGTATGEQVGTEGQAR